MKFTDLTPISLVWGFFSILPWAIALFMSFPKSRNHFPDKNSTEIFVRLLFFSLLAFLAGILSTYLILEISPLIWPNIDLKPKRPKSLLTQTIHLAFIQAGMVEEAFKIGFIFLISFFLLRTKEGKWKKEIFLVAGFTALGFAFIENSHYIISEIPDKRIETFIGRSIHSSNIHMLINLTFALFCIKSNAIGIATQKWFYLAAAFLLAVIQHGVVDFFLIPSSIIGGWIATAMFVGIWVWVVNDFRSYILELKKRKI
ncbi:MAG: PrsW family glutamic-type intramembrane protease [Leptospiraceae bacterium]|nr:PrsW family glutamic-type intramembrane protease [Leptospiraceae bacterium]MCZ8347967.1 PrsW family glutamic-type intramembrane protease [Leptospiraceae bacterium]PJE02678.1 MAG: PrsW family intramembrane metalloprotease [Leptospira sp.]